MTAENQPDVTFSPEAMAPGEMYFLLTSLIVPRPVAWVSTVDALGVRNLAPYSYFSFCSSTPPILHFTANGAKNTLSNVRQTGEFVVNIADGDLMEAMNVTAAEYPPDEDEFEWAGVQARPARLVKPPAVAKAKIVIECTLREIMDIGEGSIVFGDIVHISTAAGIWRDGRIDPLLLRPVGRLGNSHYTVITETNRIPRPTWQEMQASGRRSPTDGVPT